MSVMHLFVVHSMITYRVALAVIQYRHLDPKDCSFCTYRNFHIPQDGSPVIEQHIIDTKYTWSSTYQTLTGLGLRQRFNIACVDRFLRRAAHRKKFEVYLPQTQYPLGNLAVSHPDCIRYHLLEEGYGGYRTDEFDENDSVFSRWSRDMENLKHRRFRTVHRSFLCFRHDKFGSMFAAFPESFHGGKNIVAVPGVFQTLDVSSWEPLDAFLVVDTLIQYRPNVSIPLYIRALDYLISEHFIPLGYRHVLYKPRQFEGDEELRQGLSFLTQKYAAVLVLESLPDDCCFENVIYSCAAPVYFVQSSVGFYAQAMGKKTYTTFDVCSAFDPEWTDEFYTSSRNRMMTQTGIAKLPCSDAAAIRISLANNMLDELNATLNHA